MKKLTITTEHLTRAIKAGSQKDGELVNKLCILAQAANDYFEDEVVCGTYTINTKSKGSFNVSEEDKDVAEEIVRAFDYKDYTLVEAMLPVELSLIEKKKGE